MPELPEVETVKNSLKKKILKKKILEMKVLYPNIIEYPDINTFKTSIINETINDIHRRGKWLVFELSKYYMLCHLRMEGKFFLKTNNDIVSRHEHVIFVFEDGQLRYHDTRKFGKFILLRKEDILKKGPLKELGLEPWDEKLTTNYLKQILSSKSTSIKINLLDQSIIAGIGNIYANEILFASAIHPLKKAASLSNDELQKIIDNTRIILKKAIELGGTTIHSYSSLDGITGRFQNELQVHGKEGTKCPRCQNTLMKITVGGRGTYFCDNCQKME